MNSIRDLRKYHYEYRHKRFPFIKEWKKNPYSCLKARLYIEGSVPLVYLLLKTKIKPNTVTIAYCLLGILGGILLAIPINVTILIAIFIFFLKGTLDWTDGFLAKIKEEISVTGDILDLYGAVLGAVAFQMGLGFYVAQKSGIALFYYLIPLIPLFYFGRLHYYAFSTLFRNHTTIEKIKEYSKKDLPGDLIGLSGYRFSDEEAISKKYGRVWGRLYNLIRNLLDDRARTVDFVCLLLLIEMFTPIFITWIIFLGFVIRQFLIFLASFYIIAKGNWAEKQLESKAKEISGSFSSDINNERVSVKDRETIS